MPALKCISLSFLFTIAGCSPLYVLRAGYEELRILCRREPIEEVLKGDLSPETRSKLELTLAVRIFARNELGLNVGGSYSSMARVDANQIVFVVSASPWNRLEAYTWWFPIVGRVPYRGYFDKAGAEKLAEKMERKGYDTYVRPSVAFSTLGWFDDPLLSVLLRYDPSVLAEVIIHELLHNTIYLAGQTAFNESFANFVGNRGAMLFFEQRGDAEMAKRARARFEDTLVFSGFLEDLVSELKRVYREGIDREQRTKLFETAQKEFRAIPWQTPTYNGFGTVRLNNAVIMQQWIYVRRLDLFERIYQANGADLASTIRRIEEIGKKSPEPFAALQNSLNPEP